MKFIFDATHSRVHVESNVITSNKAKAYFEIFVGMYFMSLKTVCTRLIGTKDRVIEKLYSRFVNFNKNIFCATHNDSMPCCSKKALDKQSTCFYSS